MNTKFVQNRIKRVFTEGFSIDILAYDQGALVKVSKRMDKAMTRV